MDRSHTCNELQILDNKKDVHLIGWTQRIRDHGGKKFIDLRDRYGKTQIVFDPDVTKNFSLVENFRREFLIKIKGKVRPRPEGTINEKLKTGEIEVLVDEFDIINECDVLPFDIDEEHSKDVNEDLRLEYRYLDLRRNSMKDSLIKRHKFISAIRNYLDKIDFVEVETPYLTKSTPEGARDMLVPSRKHHGSFYALPQSPQLFKQLLMIAGLERYYQIARCFRDEDSRKDRQLEFTQVDVEMSFIDFDSFKKIMQETLIKAFEVYDIKIKNDDFKVLTYDEAIDKYGSDKPDLRIEKMELININDIVENCGFAVFKKIAQNNGLVKGLKVEKGQEKLTRKDVDKLIEFCQSQGAKGMAWMKVLENSKLESSITKFFNEDELKKISKKFNAKEGDYLFFIADDKNITNDILDSLRRHLAEKLNLIKKEDFKFVWIIDFPLFQFNEEEKRIDAEHSPFTMPNEDSTKFIEENIKTKDDINKYKNDILKLKGDCYDLALNGIEVCSGALRIYKPQLQKKVFEIINMSDEIIERQFGWFLKAYNYGAPYHRGLAFGIDRIIMLLEDKKSIRDVMAFPKNKTGYCPLTKSPSKVENEQLKELNIKLDIPKVKK
jgi:aspartyl-tRNA synthetase